MGLWQRTLLALKAFTSGPNGILQVLGAGGEAPRRSNQGLLAAYKELPWLRAVVGRVSAGVAATEWQLFAPSKDASGQRSKAVARRLRAVNERRGPEARRKELVRLKAEGELQEIEEHPLLDLLYGGNAFMSGSTVRRLVPAYLDVVGEAFWMIERDGLGIPSELLPLPPTWVPKIATPKEPWFELEFEGFRSEVPASEIVYFFDPDLRNPYARGTGTAGALHDELATDEFAAKHTMRFFLNDARPSILVSGEGMGEAEARRLEAKWIQRHEGFRNAYRPAFLNGPISVHELTQSFQDMQITELRQFERDTVIQVFGVPPEIVGVIENSNRATIQAADYLFARWVLLPRLEYEREVIQAALVPQFDERLILDYVSPVQEDKEHNLNVARAAPWSLMIDEWREMMDLEPLDNEAGQVFMMPFNLVPQETPSLVPISPPTGSTPTDPEPDEEEPEELEAPVEDGERTLRQVMRIEAGANGHGEKILAGTIGGVVGRLLPDGLEAILRRVVRGVVEAFGRGAVTDVSPDMEFDANRAAVLQFLDQYGGEKIVGINETTRSAIRAALLEGVAQDESIDELKKRIEGVFEDAKGSRAQTVARTEVVGASNFGALEGFRQAGVPGKEWLSERDEDVRATHRALDGQKRTIEQNFDSPSGASGPHPGALGTADEDIQCRCGILPLLNADDIRTTDDEEMRAAMWRAFDRDRAPFERQLRSEVQAEFEEQKRIILTALDELAAQEVGV